ncbi:MAG: serine/threonine-protein kinase [Polyangiaceae bacterium]
MWNDPEVFGGFLLIQRLAESAMASVHLAVRLGDTSGRVVVLKRPPLGERPSGRAAQAILREAEVLAAVRGAGVPALEAAGDIAGLPYVALERLRGASLAKVLAAGGPLPYASVRAIGRDIARALARLHEAGWVHRDVTPSNIFVDDSGEAYLLDFGLCAHDGDERGADVAGTRGYAAPEAVVPGAARPARDVYGLAVCLAEATLGRRLFDESSLVEAGSRGDAPARRRSLAPPPAHRLGPPPRSDGPPVGHGLRCFVRGSCRSRHPRCPRAPRCQRRIRADEQRRPRAERRPRVARRCLWAAHPARLDADPHRRAPDAARSRGRCGGRQPPPPDSRSRIPCSPGSPAPRRSRRLRGSRALCP